MHALTVGLIADSNVQFSSVALDNSLQPWDIQRSQLQVSNANHQLLDVKLVCSQHVDDLHIGRAEVEGFDSLDGMCKTQMSPDTSDEANRLVRRERLGHPLHREVDAHLGGSSAPRRTRTTARSAILARSTRWCRSFACNFARVNAAGTCVFCSLTTRLSKTAGAAGAATATGALTPIRGNGPAWAGTGIRSKGCFRRQEDWGVIPLLVDAHGPTVALQQVGSPSIALAVNGHCCYCQRRFLFPFEP
mmetsp:Transcript_6921/g.19256  ORF Transcript_6921/g.19256 Transcript_6921/m.19256 type:complete len:247 (-) Transcript_6921:248-988(-)